MLHNDEIIKKSKVNKDLNFVLLLLFLTVILSNFETVNLFQVTLVISFLYMIFKFYIHMKKKAIKRKILLLELYFVALFLFTLLQGKQLSEAKDIIKFGVFIAIGYIFASFQSITVIKKCLKYFTILLIPTAIFGIVQMLTGTNRLDRYLLAWGDSLHQGSVSIFLQHIVFGHILVILFVLNTYYIQTRWLRIINNIIIIIALYSSNCRSAWLTVALCIVAISYDKIATFGKGKIDKYKILKVSLMLLFFIFLVCLFRDNTAITNSVKYISERFVNLREYGAQYRSKTIISLLSERLTDINPIHWLLGSGYGSCKVYLKELGISLSNNNYVVDNQWVTVFIDLGSISIFLFAIYFLKCFQIFLKNKELKPLALTQLVNMMMLFVYEGFGFQIIAFIIFSSMGIMLACLLNKSQQCFY